MPPRPRASRQSASAGRPGRQARALGRTPRTSASGNRRLSPAPPDGDGRSPQLVVVAEQGAGPMTGPHFQQRPTPPSGTVLVRAWIRLRPNVVHMEPLPRGLNLGPPEERAEAIEGLAHRRGREVDRPAPCADPPRRRDRRRARRPAGERRTSSAKTSPMLTARCGTPRSGSWRSRLASRRRLDLGASRQPGSAARGMTRHRGRSRANGSNGHPASARAPDRSRGRVA